MTPHPSSSESPSPTGLDPVAAVRRALDLANVRFENVFARREEIVVVLPGRGLQREAAAAATAKTELQGRFFVSIMAEQGMPRGLLTLLAVVCIALGAFATALMFWGYLGGSGNSADVVEEGPSDK